MTESQFKTRVMREIKKALPGCWTYHASDKWVSGIPDVFILWCGIFAAIELKVGKNKPTKLQLIVLERLAAAGAITRVCWTMAEVREVLNKIYATKHPQVAYIADDKRVNMFGQGELK